MNNKPDSLFLSEAYKDAWQDYQRSINSPSYPTWDYVFLTASNEHQAHMYELQIQNRKNYLPQRTRYIVIPDEGEVRVGSGGATLSVLKKLREHEDNFEGIRVLVIHSGGDSKRIPQYSACGKLFSSVPHKLPDQRNSTLFDELLVSISSLPGRIKEGMLLLSGDVMLLFNPLTINFGGKGAAAISFKEDVNTGKNHGVYLGSNEGFVKQFFHKQSVETLKEKGAVNDKGQVDIDTGAVIFGTDILNSLWSLISKDGWFDNDKYKGLVNNETCLSLYADFLYPLASDSTLLDFYIQKPEKELNEALKQARSIVWDVLSKYQLKLFRLAPAKFIHFGTSVEIQKLINEDIDKYKELGWSNNIGSSRHNINAYNSLIEDNVITKGKVFIEDSYIHDNVVIGNNSILSGVEIKEGTIIPEDVVIHGLKQLNGKYVYRIYGINDNPKETLLFGKDIKETLWNANIYPEFENKDDALDYALGLYKRVNNNDLNIFNPEYKSLCSGFNDADSEAILNWNDHLSEIIEVAQIMELIENKVPVSEIGIKLDKLDSDQSDWFKKKIENSPYDKKMRLYFYLGKITDDEEMIINAFKALSDTILKETMDGLKENKDLHILFDEYKVTLPLRVNFGGGWSDTPPYCNENGGTVINAAITLNGKNPVEVTLRKLNEPKIIFESQDMDVYGEFEDIKELQKVGDPFDPFVLQKSALLACGIIPLNGSSLKEITQRLGGGIYMSTEVTGVPKGSGLGTSSILAAACVKALFEFTGMKYKEEDLYSHVLAMEQLMSTGGGWQDQIGGLSEGIKLISSDPGINQIIKVEHLKLKENTLKELNNRFTLIYTGQRRLARNLLRDVVGRYIGNEKDTLYALKEIQNVAVKMKESLLKGDIDGFALLLRKHWNLSKMIDEGSTNPLIDEIFKATDDLLDGKMVCGAGGGGFLQVVLKKNISKEDLQKRLKETFPDTGIEVWDCKI